MMRRAMWVVVVACGTAWGQGIDATKPTGAMARTVMTMWPDGSVLTTKSPGQWGYEEGVLLDGMAAEYEVTKDRNQFSYIKTAVDKYVTKDGTIQMNASGRAFASDEHQLDLIELGRAVMFVYRQTHEEKYAKAAKFLHGQLDAQPRTASGGYWHKTIYPNQMWLDGAYMAEPFRAEYAATFHEDKDWDDIAKQFLLMYEHMRDPKTGLLKHGWDESKKMAWADPATGDSPEIWARALGWYCMGLVDVLDWFPKDNPQRGKLVDTFQKLMAAVARYEDPQGVWWQVMESGPRLQSHPLGGGVSPLINPEKGNYPEASASCMFVYALAKGSHKGYLRDEHVLADARRGWEGIQKNFVKKNADGTVTLTGTVKVGGLGGTPYRSGTYEYYVGEKTGDNDAKGIGAYLMAGAEMSK